MALLSEELPEEEGVADQHDVLVRREAHLGDRQREVCSSAARARPTLSLSLSLTLSLTRRAAPPPRRSPRNSPRTSATDDEPGVSPELPPGTPPPHAPVEALVDTVELWGLDEHACRTMRGACAEHVPIRNSMCALPRP